MAEIKRFKDQDYKLLQNEHSSSNLFIDPAFPAVLESLSHSGKSPSADFSLADIEWKRPKVMCVRSVWIDKCVSL